VREELIRREQEVEKERREKEAIVKAEARAKAEALATEQSMIMQEKQRDRSAGSGLGLQDFLGGSPPTPMKPHKLESQSTLKEIAELKNEIIKLTTSLRTFKNSESPRH
jgi:hypothetical protein